MTIHTMMLATWRTSSFDSKSFLREPIVEYVFDWSSSSDTATTIRLGIVPLCFSFWTEAFIFLTLQSLFNVFVGTIVYYTIVVDQLSPTTTTAAAATTRIPNRKYFFGYGILCPFLTLGPLYLFGSLIECHNVALMLCLAGAIPNLLLLRVVEAVHGLLPDFCCEQRSTPDDISRNDDGSCKSHGSTTTMVTKKKSINLSIYSGNSGRKNSPFRMFLIYYSAPLQFRFDPSTQQPIPLRRDVFWTKIRTFVSVLIQTSIMFSILQPLDYQLLPEQRPEDLVEGDTIASLIGYLGYLYQPSHLINSYCMASLLSLTLEGGAAGLGLIFSLLSGLEMEDFSRSPMTQSTSVSDFWGQRWDRPVASALKRGAFRPLRIDGGCSREVAGLTVFALSGLIHEYVLYFMSLRRGGNDYDYWTSPTKGRQAVFFLVNGLLLVVERILERTRSSSRFIHTIMTSFSRLPQPVRTTFVILLVLPLGSWFTDEYIQTSFFDDSALGFPLLTIKRIRKT